MIFLADSPGPGTASIALFQRPMGSGHVENGHRYPRGTPRKKPRGFALLCAAGRVTLGEIPNRTQTTIQRDQSRWDNFKMWVRQMVGGAGFATNRSTLTCHLTIRAAQVWTLVSARAGQRKRNRKRAICQPSDSLTRVATPAKGRMTRWCLGPIISLLSIQLRSSLRLNDCSEKVAAKRWLVAQPARMPMRWPSGSLIDSRVSRRG